MAPLRWGIASAGRISNDFVAALTCLPSENHQVVAVAARAAKDAKTFAENYDIPAHYGGYELLAGDKNVDVVYIGAVNTAHFDIGMLMLDHGKHILCEKPLAMNEKQAKKLIEHAKAKKLFFMEAIWSRYFPAYQHVKQLIDNGTLGEIKEVEVEFGFPISEVDRISKKSLGGGVVLDLGVYTVQVSQWAFRSEPKAIKAEGILNEEGVDLEVVAELQYANGGVSKFKISAYGELENRAIIRGTKGSVTIHNFWSPTSITTVDGTLKEWELPNPKKGTMVYKNGAGMMYEAEEVRRCLVAGLLESPDISHAESLLIARIEDELRRQVGCKYPEYD